MRFLRLLFLACAAVCAGCRTADSRAEPLAVAVTDDARLDPAPLIEALLARKGLFIHAVNGAWKENRFSAECVVKSDGQTLKAVFLAPQMRLVTITVTAPHTLAWECAPQVPRAFQPEYALADLAFVGLDAAALRSALGSGFRVEETGTGPGSVRRIFAADTCVATLERRPDGVLSYTNHIRDYRYTLRPRSGM